MTKRAIFLITLGTLLLIAGVGIVVKTLFFSPSGPAAIQINSFPKSDIYIDGEKVGQTPYANEKQKPGEHVIKLVANVGGQNLEWTGKVKLTPEALTYINRELGSDKDLSAGEILFLEKLAGGDKSEITIVTDPINAIVKLDGNPSGQTPLTIKDVVAAEHEVAISAPGYKDRFIRGKTIPGYQLNISAQLAKATTLVQPTPASPSGTATSSAKTKTPTQQATDIDKPYIIVKETPTGWLRVREAPSINATQSGKINVGEKFPLIEEQTGWAKIRYKDLLEGWVSDGYITKIK